MPGPLAFLLRQYRRLGVARATQTVGHYLQRHFRSPLLRALLASQWGDYGVPPGQSRSCAFALHPPHGDLHRGRFRATSHAPSNQASKRAAARSRWARRRPKEWSIGVPDGLPRAYRTTYLLANRAHIETRAAARQGGPGGDRNSGRDGRMGRWPRDRRRGHRSAGGGGRRGQLSGSDRHLNVGARITYAAVAADRGEIGRQTARCGARLYEKSCATCYRAVTITIFGYSKRAHRFVQAQQLQARGYIVIAHAAPR